MIKQEKIRIYVNEFLRLIVSNEDPLKNYSEIREKKDSLLDELDLNTSSIDRSEIVKELNLSSYKYLYQKKDIDINEFADQIFLNKMSNIAEKSDFKKMMKGLTKSNYLGNIYTRSSDDNHYEKTYGIDFNNVEKYINGDTLHKLKEFRGNFATFIEHYYNTKEGFELIEFYKDKLDDKSQNEFIKKLFKKMNESSLIENLIEQQDGSFNYIAGKAGSLDGFFVLKDENYNMSFNVSSTISKDVSRESDSILRHAITSKFITNAIIEAIDKEIEDNFLVSKYEEDKNIIKKVRSDLWDKYTSNPNNLIVNEGKNIFLYDAISKYIEKTGLPIKIDNDMAEIKSGNAVKDLMKDLNSSETHADRIMNAVLNTKGDITEKKMKDFFESNDDNQHKTYFVSEVTDLQATIKFGTSNLKKSMTDLKMSMVDLKAFLQISTLKNYTLDLNIKEFSKKALDFFYNNVITRRIFGEINQKKINLPWFTHNAEKIIFENFILKSNSQIQENITHLNLEDKKNLDNFLRFMLFEKNEENYIAKKLEKLGIKSNDYKELENKVLEKIHQNYANLFQKTTDLKKIKEESKRADNAEEKRREESKRANTAEEKIKEESKRADNAEEKIKNIKSSFEDQMAAAIEKAKKEEREKVLREISEDNAKAVANMQQDLLKDPNKKNEIKLNQNDDIDYTSSQKSVIDIESSATKSTHQNVTAPTIKKKLN